MMQQILAPIGAGTVVGAPSFVLACLATRAIGRRRAHRHAPEPQFAHVKECRIDVVTDDGINRIDIDVHYDDPAAACTAVRVLGTEMLPTFAHAVGACRHGDEQS